MGRLTTATIVVLISVTALVGTARPAGAAPQSLRPPVIDRDAADPTVVRAGDTYYSFTTNVALFGGINVPLARSTDLATWTLISDALPRLGAWAVGGFTWAPAVAQIQGRWVLYYTARDGASGRQCIGVATAADVTGPYTDTRGVPLVCQLDHGGSLDASPYLGPLDQWWLTWKSDDNAIGGIPGIWSQPLTADGQAMTGSPSLLLVADRPWENRIVEAPVLFAASGQLWLFYSAGPYASGAYAVGYALCTGAAGPCFKQTTDAPWMSLETTGLGGPGGQSFVTTPSGRVDMAFHAWRNAIGNENGGYRAMYVEPIDFDSGAPRLHPDWGRTTTGLSSLPAPVLASAGDGTTDLLAADTAGAVWHRQYSGGQWGDWEALGGIAISKPAAVRIGSELDVFVQGADGAVWSRRRVAGAWSGWGPLGGGLTGSPTAASTAPGTLDVFVHGLDGALWHRSRSAGAWTAWEWLGGGMIGGPAVASKGAGKLDVFVHGLDGALWHRASSAGAWTAWEWLGGGMIGGPAIASSAAGRLDVFVRGIDNMLWHRAASSSTWDGWQPLGGTLISDPTADSPNAGQEQVAVGGLDANAWSRVQTGTSWTPWSPLGATP